MLIGTRWDSLLGNLLSGKGVIRNADGVIGDGD